MSKERPIIFSGPMVRAILDGRKTMTRRVVHRLRRFGVVTEFGQSDTKGYDWHFRDKRMHWNDLRNEELLTYLPYTVGQQLWVRETWAHDARDLETARAAYEDLMPGRTYGPYYRATETAPDTLTWRSPIHMPRWASRITLEVTAVKVERLQDITEADAMAEGVVDLGRRDGAPYSHCTIPGVPGITIEHDATSVFSQLWEIIHGEGSWKTNPWVAAYTFRRVE